MSALSDISVQMTKELRRADAHLRAKHNLLANFGCIEELVCDGLRLDEEYEKWIETDPDELPPLDEKDRDGLTHSIGKIRAAVARTMWSKGYYVSTSLIDGFVLHAAKTGAGDIPNRAIAAIADAGLDQPGFVLYPLVGFQMKQPILSLRDSPLRTEAVFRAAGFAVSLQTNSHDAAIKSVQRLARTLGIRHRISESDLRHFARTVGWFGKNPLMLVKLTSHTFHMYENQFVYTLKIRLAGAHLMMLHTLSAEVEAKLERDFRAVAGANNFSTLDIRHYAIGEAYRGHCIDVIRVPMNVAPLDLARLSDVSATLATDVLATAAMKRHERLITKSLQTVERGYFRHVNMTSRSKPEKRLYSRLITALDWFRQSFSARANEAEAIVSIAVALETLLTDYYAPGIVERLRRRAALCMRRASDLALVQNSIETIYKARSEIVHTGSPDRRTDIYRAQIAFIRCFCFIASRLPDAKLEPNGTLGHLIKDTITDDMLPSTA